MPIDPSVYARLGQNQVQPLQALSQFAFAQNALNQNKLFQQTFAARQAMGPLAQQSIDPATGQMDYNKFATLISTHPETAFMAPDIINGMVSRQLTQAQTVKTNLEAAIERQGAIGAAAMGVHQQYGAAVTPGNVFSALADLHGQGILSTDDVMKYVPTFAGLKGEALDQHLVQVAASSMRGQQAANTVLGTYTPDAITNADGSKSPGFASALFGQVKPATLAGGTYGQPQQGAPGAGAAPSAPPGAPPAPSLGGNAPGSQVVSALSPFQTSRLNEAAQYGKDVASRAQQANGLVAQINIVQRYLRDINTGAFAEDRAELANALRTFGVAPEIYNKVSNGSLDDAQAAMKTFMGTGIQQAGQLIHGIGGGRLAQQETMQFLAKGSPNINMASGAVAKVMASIRELSHWATLENEYYQRKVGLAKAGGYDIGNVQNDWGNTMAQMLSAQGSQQ